MSQPLRKGDPSVAYGVKWHKLERPGPWKPTEEGAELVGYYLGQSLRDGIHGQYYIALFAVPSGDSYSKPVTVSGTALLQRLMLAQQQEHERLLKGQDTARIEAIAKLAEASQLKLLETYPLMDPDNPADVEAARLAERELKLLEVKDEEAS